MQKKLKVYESILRGAGKDSTDGIEIKNQIE